MTALLRFPAPSGAAEGRAPDFGLGRSGFEAWRAFIVAHALVTRRLDEELQAAHGISLGQYDALVQLAYAEGRTLRMNVLAERVLLSRSGVTRLVDRLVEDGLVERGTCPTDGRGKLAVLTPAGLETLRRASATHLEGVRRHYLAALSERDQEAKLARLVEIARAVWH